MKMGKELLREKYQLFLAFSTCWANSVENLIEYVSVLITKNGDAGMDIHIALETIFAFAVYFHTKKIRLDI